MLETAQLGEKKLEGAVALYQQGCALAHAESCVRVAMFMAEGVVLQQDTAKARAMLESACAEEVERACEALEGFGTAP